MNYSKNETVREMLKSSLLTSGAHKTAAEALKGLPENLRDTIPDKLPYSIWQIAEHIRIVQWDILEYSRNPDHRSPKWPDEYWPTEPAPADEVTWQKTIRQIEDDLNAFVQLITSERTDLYEPFPWAENGENLLREALLIIDHTSYHTGEIIVLRRLLDAWKS